MKILITILKFILKNWVVVIFIVIATFMQYNGYSDKPVVIFLNVGQGDAILIQQDGFQILVDGGPDDAVLYELAKYIPIYDRNIEIVVLTHAHDDHLKGLLMVLENYNVDSIWYSPSCVSTPSYQFLLKEYAGNLVKVDSSTKLQYGDISMSVIYPVETKCEENINNESIVLDVEVNGKRILLMGDAEKEVEERIFDDIGDIDILKAGHHCSRTASSEMFLNSIDPEIAICSVGEGNKFGHPHNETLEMFKKLNVQYLITYEEGNIVFELE